MSERPVLLAIETAFAFLLKSRINVEENFIKDQKDWTHVLSILGSFAKFALLIVLAILTPSTVSFHRPHRSKD